jgi:hypothetical protein
MQSISNDSLFVIQGLHLPEDLNIPETDRSTVWDHVDVMALLGIETCDSSLQKREGDDAVAP